MCNKNEKFGAPLQCAPPGVRADPQIAGSPHQEHNVPPARHCPAAAAPPPPAATADLPAIPSGSPAANASL